ncbi:MAG: putative Ig domain-containing protein, partial [Accumulibacter sp.]|uniref:putative Ig domain-containing protein n=1 Tax=Accumulibacter sp. TaxID=2053492 RepID=UPI0033158FAC
LSTPLPPIRDGNWRVIVRPDLFYEVFEGRIAYTASGLALPPGEVNNRTSSGATLQVRVPELPVGSLVTSSLSPGEARVYKISVAAGETLRVSLDAAAAEGSNEVYLRYGDLPTGTVFDAAYSNPVAADQEALVPSTRAGDYYLLVRASQGAANSPINLRADLLPLSITRITPDHGGTGDDAQRWITLDIHGSHFLPGALVKLSRPGIAEVEPDRWQVLDATHIRAVFDSRGLPHGLYDLTIINPDGQRVTEAERYLVERGVETEVTLGIGGPRTLATGESATYSVSLQNLGNLDTPYVRFDFGVPEMGVSANVLEGLQLPYLVFGSSVGGRPDGRTIDLAGNTRSYGTTPSDGTARGDIPWARLDGVDNERGSNLAPGYVLDLQAGGFVGASFTLQTYPGLAEWLAYDFAGLRNRLYALRPDWQKQGLLDGGVADLDRIADGLSRKFLSRVPDEHLTRLEALALPFRFDVAGAATPLTRDEFIADQQAHAQKLRAAILADSAAPPSLAALAADAAQWQTGWLAALEAAGLLRPLDEAPPIRDHPQVLSLNATLATGILLGKGGDSYRTEADLLGFFSKVQTWYGDTAGYAGDTHAAQAPVDYLEVRQIPEGSVEIPVPTLADAARFDFGASHATHFIDFNIFVGGQSELEYLRHIGVLDEDFKAVAGQALDLGRYLQQAAAETAAAATLLSVRGPQVLRGDDGQGYVPADTPLPFNITFSNPSETPAGQLRLVSQLDPSLDARSFRLGDIRIGDIQVHLPADQASFQGDFDFTASKGFILRISAGVEPSTGIATWLLQAIDPDSGEVLRDATRGLLAGDLDGASNAAADASGSATDQLRRGFASYSVRAATSAAAGSEIAAAARLLVDDAPPIDSETARVRLDTRAPQTTLKITTLTPAGAADAAPIFDLQWSSIDDLSGVKSVTLYVAEDAGDFRIWQRQLDPQTTQALFTGEAGRHYEFLAVATDRAGNREAAVVANAVLPDDGARQEVLDGLGVNATLAQTASTPLAPTDRSYPSNPLFTEASRQLPGLVASSQRSDLRAVLAPFSVRGFAEGYRASAADIGAQALLEMPDHSILASAGPLRNEVYRYGKKGLEAGSSGGTPLFTLDAPILDMAVDALGQLWVMTGAELLQVDAVDGAILQRLKAPGGDPLTHALAIDPQGSKIYVSSGRGIEVYNPAESDPARAWRHFSTQRVGDLAFAPDGRLWAVKWSGSEIASAAPTPSSEILSFPMNGRDVGRAELEYALPGVIDSIAFGTADTPLAGLLLASSQLGQRPVFTAGEATPHQSAVWMIELASRERLQLASGGTRGESIVATHDGRVLVAETGHIDEIAPWRAPLVKAVTVPNGALLPLPLNTIGVVFDQDMWIGDADDGGSVLNVDNYTLSTASDSTTTASSRHPATIRWDAGTRTAWLDVAGLQAGEYRLHIASRLQSAAEIPLRNDFETRFTALRDLSNRIRLDFSHTRADRATGEVSYDVSVTNIGSEAIEGPLTLLLDPGQHFAETIAGATTGGGDQADLWVLDLGSALLALGGRLPAGATINDQTVTIVPGNRLAAALSLSAGMAELVKANLGHGIYALPQDTLPPTLSVAGETDADQLPPAQVGEAWTAEIEAFAADTTRLYWQLLDAPAGISLTPSTATDVDAGTQAIATLNWTPTARAAANSEIRVRVEDSRGGFAWRRFRIAVADGNHAPTFEPIEEFRLKEGETLALPLRAADADGDHLTQIIRNLPPGATFDAARGLLTWTPGYDQAGVWSDITHIVSDGKATSSRNLAITVEQAYPMPVLDAPPVQALREGESFALQLAGFVPGQTTADSSTLRLEYGAPWLPGGATLNPETGWLAWTPSYNQHGRYTVPVTLTAIWTATDGTVSETRIGRELVLDVANANGAPIFAPAETWNALEGQPLRISVFAFDPDNPEFAPKIRLRPGADAIGPETTPATVGYEISVLPPGAVFDAETLEIVWTPAYDQAGTYVITVTATDNGDPSSGTEAVAGTAAVSQLHLPIVVGNANRAPSIADIPNTFVERGSVIEIPVFAEDADERLAGSPITLSFSGLPRFARFIENSTLDSTHGPVAGPGEVRGVLRVAPAEGDRGDYTITLTATDDGDSSADTETAAGALSEARSFVLSVQSFSEAPQINAPRQVVAVVGQPLAVAVAASDLDQDPLTWFVDGLPLGAELRLASQYGQATLAWTPTADDVGNHEIELIVSDSGLPPRDAGYIEPADPVPNVSRHRLRIVVRAENAAPELVGLQVDGERIADNGGTLRVDAREGTPLAIDFFGDDADADFIDWQMLDLPPGMQAIAVDNHLSLSWTPDRFAAQGSNTATIAPGLWRFSVGGSDGMATFSRTLEVAVANVNQAPRLLPLPLQLVNEGETLNFTVRAADADHDAVQLALLHDDSTPPGVAFNPASGSFEWTPDQDTVDNGNADSRPYTFSFSASDGLAVATQQVQVRVFDRNRRPQINVGNHAVAVGDTLSLPVVFDGSASNGISVFDTDGTIQSQALTLGFANLPTGAIYDSHTQRLTWTPGPGQIGDTLVTAQVYDGRPGANASSTHSFVLRAVPDLAAQPPQILISATPSLPVNPGQLLLVSVRADAWSGIARLAVEVRSNADEAWQSVALDAAGRLRLTPLTPGLIDLRVTATDRDGFTATRTHSVRVKDPSDNLAPQLAWDGTLGSALAGSSAVEMHAPTALSANLREAQLIGWRLQVAAAGSDAWTTLAEQEMRAIALDQPIALGTIDPGRLANGVWRLRLTAWDLAGRSSEIESRIVVDSTDKAPPQALVTDATYALGGHTLALTRLLSSLSSPAAEDEPTGTKNPGGDFGNWALPLLDTQLSSDQPATLASGATAAWLEGARVWLNVPEDLSTVTTGVRSLSFTLTTGTERLGNEAEAAEVRHPLFSSSHGWTLEARATAGSNPADSVLRQGNRLYDLVSGLPWVPGAYTLIAPTGDRYELDGQGHIQRIEFADGAQWLVSDAGVAALTADGHPAERLEFARDGQGRIIRISGVRQGQAEPSSTAYRYDSQGRLVLVRSLDAADDGRHYGYAPDGRLQTDTLSAHLGTPSRWDGVSNAWTGELSGTAVIGFTIRDDEIASTAHLPGAAGAVMVAITSETDDPAATLECVGGQTLGSSLDNGTRTTLLRISEGGLKLLRLTGNGHATLSVSVAGDLNLDGHVDALDSARREAEATDINGDGMSDHLDRQILYANSGFAANQAPTTAELPLLQTHIDLGTTANLASTAHDPEGDRLFWRVLDATHGTAQLGVDGQTLIFTPATGYTGTAQITVQADDGYNAGTPIELVVNVSGARLTAIHLAPLARLQAGQTARVHATLDFEDQQGVALTDAAYLDVTVADIAGMGYVGTSPLQVDDARDQIRATGEGPALVVARRMDGDGRMLQTVAAINVQPALPTENPTVSEEEDAPEALAVKPDVYP